VEKNKSDKKKQNVTIKHIAEYAGVSFSTVAKALRNDPVVNKKTKDKIHDIAQKFNYYPNILAKGLRSKKTKTIGIILNDLQSPFYSEIYKVIGDILNEQGYTMLLCDSNFDLELEKKNIITMISQGVDGIIISTVNEKSDNIKIILDNDLKAVFIDNIPEFPDTNYVYANHEEAASLAVQHLVENGHREILLLNGPEVLSSSHHFLKGYREKLFESGIEVKQDLLRFIDISVEKSQDTINNIFSGKDSITKKDFTAILTISDITAIGVYEAAQNLHFSIPDDYSIIGYDNILATKYLAPPLTTVHQPKKRTGEYSTNLILEQIKNDSKELKKIILSPKLIVRESVKKMN